MKHEAAEYIRRSINLEVERNESKALAAFPRLPAIPISRYVETGFWDLEQKYMWPRVWLLAAHVDDFPERGSYKLWDDSGISIVLVRGKDDVIRAYYNACRHRGGPLVYESQGTVTALSCKFHGWTYALDGDLRFVPDEHDFPGLDKCTLGLKQLRCESWGNFLFVNRDATAPSLLDWLGRVGDEFRDFRPESRHVYARVEYILECNWKIAMENNSEAYHFATVHPETVNKMMDCRGNLIDLYRNGHSRLITPYNAVFGKQVFALLDVGGVNSVDPEHAISREVVRQFAVSPNLLITTGEFQFPLMTFWPMGKDRTKLVVHYTTPFKDDDPESASCKGVVEGFGMALEEDRLPLSAIQNSYSNGSIDGALMGYAERRLYHLQEEIDRTIGYDNIPERYRVVPATAPFIDEVEHTLT